MLVFASFTYGHTPSRAPEQFAGCYEVTSLSWDPPDNKIKLIPNRFELLNTPVRNNEFKIHSLRAGPYESQFEKRWSWSPKGKNKLKISWSTGLGGFYGTLHKSSNGDLAGTLKEWCDSRCGWKKETGDFHIRRTACPPN